MTEVMRTPPAQQHRVTVTFAPAYGQWLPYCSRCGWTGQYSTLQAWAVRQGNNHEENAR